MNVTLTPAYEDYVRRKVAAGDFHNEAEVLSEGLRLLQQQDAQWAAEARTKIEEGWNQAKSGQLLSPEVLRESLDVRKAVWRTSRLTA